MTEAVTGSRIAVFSGAGISGEAPASLPRGFALRDDVLRHMHTAARAVAPDLVTAAALDALVASPRKLEVVLGRLWGTIGADALRCLLALRVEVRNEAHLLAALHLALGGTHVSLNFDVGIELAYGLLTGRGTLPATAPDEYRAALPAWRALVPRDTPPLRVVVAHDEFARWAATGGRPALLKIHGSLTADQRDLVDVVVVDIEELGQLSDGRRAAIDSLRTADRLLITGYSGTDPDVYEPLLAAAERPTSTWCCYQLDTRSPVHDDTAAHGIEMRLGAPDGLAVTALRDLLGHLDVPGWPALPVPGPTYRERFDEWADWLRSRHTAQAVAKAWAWLVADLGDLDTAVAILRRLVSDGDHDPATLLRYAELRYSR
ncbi:MAG TPA: SIR2 family protein, partial [Pseudonocardiaceae bacterium]|nr:SIR2 family protein [Pseudonocardiaceae bacterium]